MIRRYRKWKRNSKDVITDRFVAYLDFVIKKCKSYEMGQLSESYYGAIIAEFREISDWFDRARISGDPRYCYEKVNELIDNSIFLRNVSIEECRD